MPIGAAELEAEPHLEGGKRMQENIQNIKSFLSAEIASKLELFTGEIREIRLRVGKPMMLRTAKGEYVGSYKPQAGDIRETVEKISQYSMYAFENELACGYITLPGGHRVGVCGQVVLENGLVHGWRFISGLNIRVAHSVHGSADGILPQILNDGFLYHTMIISPPGFGKTTILRDIVRQISDGGLTVGLVDERSEVAGSFQGVAQNDVGIRTDILDGCPKSVAMEMLLRSMSPDVIAVDELGGAQDVQAVDAVLCAGVKLLCTAHGNNIEDVAESPTLGALIGRNIFERFVVLGAPGHVAGIFNSEGGALK